MSKRTGASTPLALNSPTVSGGVDLQRVLGWLTFAAILIALYLVFIYAPREKMMGEVQRIFYFHVASAWNAFLAFAVVFVCGILYLAKGNRKYDQVAYASAEIGVAFTTIVLLTGPIWARPIWQTWWTWDPRLTTTLILWFIYMAYLVLRASAEGSESQARMAAVFGIIGFIDVPIIWVSIRWWRSIHPTIIESKGGQASFNMEPQMLIALIASVFAFTFLYVYLLNQRLRVERLAEAVAELKESLRKKAL